MFLVGENLARLPRNETYPYKADGQYRQNNKYHIIQRDICAAASGYDAVRQQLEGTGPRLDAYSFKRHVDWRNRYDWLVQQDREGDGNDDGVGDDGMLVDNDKACAVAMDDNDKTPPADPPPSDNAPKAARPVNERDARALLCLFRELYARDKPPTARSVALALAGKVSASTARRALELARQAPGW